MPNKNDIPELIAAEQAAKLEWEQSVQAVKVANENVGRAHKKWLAASNAVTIAREAARPKSQATKVAAA